MLFFMTPAAPTKTMAFKGFIIHVTVIHVSLTQFFADVDSSWGAFCCFPVEAHRQGALRPRDRGFMDLLQEHSRCSLGLAIC